MGSTYLTTSRLDGLREGDIVKPLVLFRMFNIGAKTSYRVVSPPRSRGGLLVVSMENTKTEKTKEFSTEIGNRGVEIAVERNRWR